MNNSKNENIAISLDWKKCRIRVFKETLYQIGQPDYICLLVNPKTRMIAVQQTTKDTTFSQKVNWVLLKKDRSMELYSAAFVSRIFNLNENWDDRHSYRIRGKVNKELNIAEFCINDAVAVID